MSDGLGMVAVIVCGINVGMAVRDKDIHAALGWLTATLYALMGVAK